MPGIFSIDYLLPSLMFSIALLFLREYFAYRKVLSLKYLLTPLVTFSLILMGLAIINSRGTDTCRVLVISALLMSLVADTLLMIEEVNLLKPGIVFFMLAHIFYTAAFSGGYGFRAWNILVLLILLIFLKKSAGLFLENSGEMKVPVMAYMLVISVMVFFAVTSFNRGFTCQGIFRSAGALLFLASDMLIAFNQFVREIPHSTVKTWALYAPAQVLMTLSCLWVS